jgi:hypothetical protein
MKGGGPGAAIIAAFLFGSPSCAAVVLNGFEVPMVFAFVCSTNVVASPTYHRNVESGTSARWCGARCPSWHRKATRDRQSQAYIVLPRPRYILHTMHISNAVSAGSPVSAQRHERRPCNA